MLISCMEILGRHDKNPCLSTSICPWMSQLCVFFVATGRFPSPKLFKRTDSWICTRDSLILINNSNINTLGGVVKIFPFQGSSEAEFPFPLVGYVSVPWRVGSLWICLTYKPPQRKKTSFPTVFFLELFQRKKTAQRWGNNSNSSSAPWRYEDDMSCDWVRLGMRAYGFFPLILVNSW